MHRTLAIFLLIFSISAACSKKGDKAKPAGEGDKTGAEKVETETAPMKTGEGNTGATPEPEKGQPKIVGEEVEYKVGEQAFKGYLAYDENSSEARPGVLVVHEWWGHNEYARERARMLAEMGYTAFAVDMYGDGKTADHPKDAQAFMMEVMGDANAAKTRFEAAYALLKDHEKSNGDKMAAIGYCMGGAIVLNMARAGIELDAVAAFHAGSLAAAFEAKKDALPKSIMVFHGKDDPFVPADQLEAFQAEMKGLEAPLEFVAYEGAVHGFTNPGATELGKKFELPLAYNEEADKDSWEKFSTGLERAFADEDEAAPADDGAEEAGE